MGGKFIDLTGMKFNRLTVIKKTDLRIDGSVVWECLCDCGNTVYTNTKRLKTGNTKSCGCYQRDIASQILKAAMHKENTYDLESKDYAIGRTEEGFEFYFDKEDYDLIKDYYWHTWYDKNNDSYYMIAYDSNHNAIKLHRFIMHAEEGDIVDHINHNTCDNRKINLRKTDRKGNNRNHKIRSDNTSGVTGVNWHKGHHKWITRINTGTERITVGEYDDFDEAVAARKDAEKKYYGEYAYDESMKYAEQYEIS